MVAELTKIIADGITERLLTAHDVTVAGVLLAGILLMAVGFLREWIVTGPQYRRMIAERDAQLERVRADRDKWFNLAWQVASTAKTGVQAAHEATQTLKAITSAGGTIPSGGQFTDPAAAELSGGAD